MEKFIDKSYCCPVLSLSAVSNCESLVSVKAGLL